MRDPIINDGQARRIASEWHSGQASALCSLATTGAIDLDGVRCEIAYEVQRLDVGKVRRDLLALDKYVLRRAEQLGRIGPVPGWHQLWDETPVDLEQS